ncbi:polysaccharide biosynthesis tyrosine autokinase [Sphingomonas sp. VNH70]|uniref:GumC family protein n=1 Tax=Sphingomonas silueang TaxID=3156617 RepID=UPI0032B43216
MTQQPIGALEPAPGDAPRDADRVVEDAALLPDADDDAGFDPRAIWAAIYRNRLVMLLIVAAALVLGVISVMVMPRIYQARSSVQIDQQVAKVLGTEDSEPTVAGTDADRFLQTQVDVINSRAMAKRVSDSLGLAANDAFLESMGGRLKLRVPGERRIDQVLDTLQKNLNVDLRRNSRVVGIQFKSRDAGLAARVANSYASNFIESNIQRKFSTSAYSREFLQSQLALAKGRLEASERSLINYARSAQLIDASAGAQQIGQPEGPRSLVTANLVQLNENYATAAAARLQAQQRYEQARATPLLSLPDVLSNPAAQEILQRRAELNSQLNQLRERLKPDHPTVVQATAQIAELNAQLNQLAGSILNSIRNQYLTAQRQQDAIESQVARLKSATLAEQDRGVQYNILKREVDTNRQLYESLLQRFKEVSAEAGVATNNVTMVDTAETPRRPTSPRPLVNMALALVAGLFLAGLYAFGRERLDDVLRDPRDVETRLHLPLLGVVPEQEDGDPLVALRDTKSEIAESYHAIRTALELSSNQGLPRSILVTSSQMSEGKSTTSYALARDFASIGHRVLLIDADLRRPSLHRLVDVKQTDKGLSTVLARMTPVEEVVVPTDTANLAFLPSGPLPPDPANLFAGSAPSELLARLGGQYDLIVLDGPPVLALADATALSASAAATVVIAEAGGAHFGQVRNALTRLVRAQGHLLGIIVTKYNSRKSGYAASEDYYRYNYRSTAQ